MLIINYIKIYTIELLRNKSAMFFTIIFPTILLLLFGGNAPDKTDAQWAIYISLINYAVQCAMFQALGMGIAHSRSRKWAQYVKLLPVSPSYLIGGRILAMLIFATISLLLVLIVGIFYLPIHANFLTFLKIIMIGIIGGIPMGLFGIYLGQLVSAATARSVFVLVNLVLFFSAFSLPDQGFFSLIRTFIPSYQWLTLSYEFSLKNSINSICLFGLIGYTVTFFFLALFAAKND